MTTPSAAQQALTQKLAEMKQKQPEQNTPATSAPISATAPKEPEPKQAPADGTRVFRGEFPEYSNHVTPTGGVVGFYKGYFVTQDASLADWVAKNVAGAKEVTGQEGLQIPVVPNRKRARNWAAADQVSATTMSPAELMQRSIGTTANLPQAGESNSQVAN